MMQMEREEQEKRYFKAKDLPEFEAPNIMPSQKPITVAIKPAFASDQLPRKQPKEPIVKESSEPKDFVF